MQCLDCSMTNERIGFPNCAEKWGEEYKVSEQMRLFFLLRLKGLIFGSCKYALH